MTNLATENDISYTVAPVATRELFPSVVARVFNYLSSIASNDALFERDEARPSKETIEWAERVLLRVLPRYYLRTAEIDVFHGEIHVTWEKGDKRVVAFLISPGPLKVYVEQMNDTGNVEHVLHPDIQPQALNPILTWLYA